MYGKNDGILFNFLVIPKQRRRLFSTSGHLQNESMCHMINHAQKNITMITSHKH